jgi:very-short-patch-repair endonuclease
MRGKQLDGMKFRRQYGVDEYVIDLYCPEVKLAIEVDGESHFDPTSRLHDERRLAFLESLGIRVLRFTNPQAYGQLDAVIEEIWRVAKERIAGRGNDPPESPLGKGGGQAPLLDKEGVGGGRNTAKLAPAGNDPPESPLGKGGGDPPESPLGKGGGDPPVSPLGKGGGL